MAVSASFDSPEDAGRRRCGESADTERDRARRYPISRWYVCPIATRLAAILKDTWVRPHHFTLLGLLLAAAAGAILFYSPRLSPWAAALVLAAWFCDRTDGPLARRRGKTSAWGAWLDGNIDELVDIGLHIAVATAAATQMAWYLLMAFLAGKYLFLHGLSSERELVAGQRERGMSEQLSPESPQRGLFHTLYHMPGNADVRVHLLILALACGWFTAELAFVGVYFNLRWAIRYGLVARRLGGGR